MNSCHDVVSVIGEEALRPIRECYSIPEEYVLWAPSAEQQPYSAGSFEISISMDALEVDLCFPLHPTIVSGALTNNKGWKARYFFIGSLSWGFIVEWSVHPISNIPPLLSEEEFVMVNRLKGILLLSRVTQDMTEMWLVEAGLSPASRGISAFDALSHICRLV
ncbi:hypothetical protein BHM03_00021314 [Ensete ventricosum]|nr:hypothetical protein BHM03_00021314 [Ensete ventricosum]